MASEHTVVAICLWHSELFLHTDKNHSFFAVRD